MKRKSTYEYIALIFLSLVTGLILYRQMAASATVPVYAATLRPSGPAIDMPLTAPERQVIREYLLSFSSSKSHKTLPPGLVRTAALRGHLTPDWEKKLVKG